MALSDLVQIVWNKRPKMIYFYFLYIIFICLLLYPLDSVIIIESYTSRDLDRHHLDMKKRQSIVNQILLLRWVSDAILT